MDIKPLIEKTLGKVKGKVETTPNTARSQRENEYLKRVNRQSPKLAKLKKRLNTRKRRGI